MFTAVKQSRNGEYLQVCENYRDAGRVRQRLILYVGPYPSVDDALVNMPKEIKNLRTQATKRERSDLSAIGLQAGQAAMIAELRSEAGSEAERLAGLRELVEKDPGMVERDRARAIRRAAGAEARDERRELGKIKKRKSERKKPTAKDTVLEIRMRQLERAEFPDYVQPFGEIEDQFVVCWAKYLMQEEPDPEDFEDRTDYTEAMMKREREHVGRDGLKAEALRLFDALPQDQQEDVRAKALFTYELRILWEALEDRERQGILRDLL